MKLSLLVPVYNEEKIIKDTLDKILKFFKTKKYTWEVILIDDGSSDATVKIANQVCKSEKKLRLIKLSKNLGKGGALREGFNSAKGEVAIYSDADLSVDLNYIDKFLEQLEKYDVVIGSRRVKGAKIEVHQDGLRESLGRVFTFLTKTYLMLNIADFTCGFKGFTKKAYSKIFSKSIVNRWAYDSEILFLAKKYNLSIYQYPVVWRNRFDSRVRLSGVILESFVDLVKIRLYDLLGKYA